MKILGYLLLAFIIFGVWAIMINPGGHVRIGTRDIATAKSFFNVLSQYATDHGGDFPDTADRDFLEDCVELGYITESELSSCVLKDVPNGSTGFFYIKGQRQTMKGSNLLLISEHPIVYPDWGPHYIALTISGKAEAEAIHYMVPSLAQAIRQKAERALDAKKTEQSPR